MSFFKKDLAKEKLLSIYLDTIYNKLNLNFDRATNLKLQHKGVDLIYHAINKDYFIDEKAQLDYINNSLPTFTFELSYFKNNIKKTGWFMDPNKITTHYFLITGIYANDAYDLYKGFKKCSITSVNKEKLNHYLNSIHLTNKKLNEYEETIREQQTPVKKNIIKELNPQKEGCIFYSPQLSEKPINLQLRIRFLIEKGIAKSII